MTKKTNEFLLFRKLKKEINLFPKENQKSEKFNNFFFNMENHGDGHHK